MEQKGKTTNVDLVRELTERNKDGRYDILIKNAQENWYHDFKQPDEAEVPPKLLLINDLNEFPELNDIRSAAMNGEYDEPADEDDKAAMSASLDNPALAEIIGLTPSKEEKLDAALSVIMESDRRFNLPPTVLSVRDMKAKLTVRQLAEALYEGTPHLQNLAEKLARQHGKATALTFFNMMGEYIQNFYIHIAQQLIDHASHWKENSGSACVLDEEERERLKRLYSNKFPEVIEINTRLVTKDGWLTGNAIVYGFNDKSYIVKTDYGHEMKLTREEIESQFYFAGITDNTHKHFRNL